MKKIFKSVMAATLMATLLAGCSSAPTETAAPAADGATTAATEGGSSAEGGQVITLGLRGDLVSFDPHNHNDTTSAMATRHIYDNLVTLNENNEFIPQLAESWEYADDLTINFKLKEGVKFHDGSTLTAEDVKFSLERQKDSAKVGHLVSMISEVEVVDDYNFILHLSEASNAVVSSLYHSGSAILSKAYTEALEAEGKTLESAPMGCGPYTYAEWTPGASFSLAKYADYYNPDMAAMNDGLEFRVIPEDSARTIALETGELDIIIDVSTTDADRIRESETLALDEIEKTHIEYFATNHKKAPFDNVLVRQALNHAINKADVVTVAIDDEGKPFDNYIGSAAIGYYDVAVKYDYDVEKAKALLAEAGYADGFTFTCLISSDVRAKSATVIQANLAELGITMNIEQMESATFFAETGAGEHEALLSGWIANAEPDNTYRPLFTTTTMGDGGNRAFYENPDIDVLVDKAATDRDPQVVEDSYKEILTTISEDAVWVPLYAPTGMIARNKDLQGFIFSPINMHDLYGMHY